MRLRWLPVTAARPYRSAERAIRVTLALEHRSLFDFGSIPHAYTNVRMSDEANLGSNFCLTDETNRTFEHSFHPYSSGFLSMNLAQLLSSSFLFSFHFHCKNNYISEHVIDDHRVRVCAKASLRDIGFFLRLTF